MKIIHNGLTIHQAHRALRREDEYGGHFYCSHKIIDIKLIDRGARYLFDRGGIHSRVTLPCSTQISR